MRTGEFEQRADVDGVGLGPRLRELAPHAGRLAQTLVRARVDVVRVRIRFDGAAIGAEQRLLALLWVDDGLEDESGRGTGGGGAGAAGRAWRVIEEGVGTGVGRAL